MLYWHVFLDLGQQPYERSAIPAPQLQGPESDDQKTAPHADSDPTKQCAGDRIPRGKGRQLGHEEVARNQSVSSFDV